MGFYGIICGAGGAVQVDPNKANLPLLSTGTFYNLVEAPMGHYYEQTVSTPNGEIVAACAFRPISDCYSTVVCGRDPNGKYTKVIGMNGSGGAFQYAIYSQTAQENPSGYGMVIYDGDSGVVFSSKNRYPKIRNVLLVDRTYLRTPPRYIDIVHGVPNAYFIVPRVQGLEYFEYVNEQGYQGYVQHLVDVGLQKINDTTVRVGLLDEYIFQVWTTYELPWDYTPRVIRIAVCEL